MSTAPDLTPMQKMLQAATKKPTYLKGSSDAIFSKAVPLVLGTAAAGALVRVCSVCLRGKKEWGGLLAGVESHA